jgi:hypothetical protein
MVVYSFYIFDRHGMHLFLADDNKVGVLTGPAPFPSGMYIQKTLGPTSTIDCWKILASNIRDVYHPQCIAASVGSIRADHRR